MAAMLSRLGGRGYQVQEDRVAYGNTESDFDPDSDSDFDLDGDNKEPQQIAPPYPVRPRDARPHWSGEHDVRRSIKIAAIAISGNIIAWIDRTQLHFGYQRYRQTKSYPGRRLSESVSSGRLPVRLHR
jgi:hypothetical protein